MSAPDAASADFCYRHPDRRSFIVCQRCTRTICPSCQTQAAVGFHCPECVNEARANAPRTSPKLTTKVRRLATGGGPIVTYSLIGVTAFVYVLQLLLGGIMTNLLAYAPILTGVEPWRMLTTVFVHSQTSFLHILFNMFTLFIFGRLLEPAIGHGRFLLLYLLSGFGGSLAVLLLNPDGVVVGASGAVYGLFGAFFAIQRGLGGNSAQLIVLIGINLLIGFFVPGIAWQAHVGGLLIGGLIGLILLKTRGPRHRRRQVLMLGGVAIGMVLLTVVAFSLAF